MRRRRLPRRWHGSHRNARLRICYGLAICSRRYDERCPTEPLPGPARMTISPGATLAPFNPEKLRRQSWAAAFIRRLLDDPRRLAAMLRCVWPIARLGRYALVT